MKQKPKNNLQTIERLFKEHYPLLCLISLGIVKDKHIAKDVVQDFFISYWQKEETLFITTTFMNYAARAVKNLSLLHLEKTKKEKLNLKNLNIPDYEEQPPFDRLEHNHKIQELLNQIPEKRRNIFISFVVHGMSYSEIAKNNDITINTVKTQMKRAYAFLRAEAPDDFLYFFLIITINSL